MVKSLSLTPNSVLQTTAVTSYLYIHPDRDKHGSTSTSVSLKLPRSNRKEGWNVVDLRPGSATYYVT